MEQNEIKGREDRMLSNLGKFHSTALKLTINIGKIFTAERTNGNFAINVL